MPALEKYSDHLYSLIRIVAGFMFTLHGVQKVFGVLGRDAVELTSLLGVAGLVELVAGTLITLGLFTSWAAFISSGQMAFAYFIAHAPRGFWPVMNDGERAVLYCFLFLFVAAYGSGRFSLDGLIRRQGS